MQKRFKKVKGYKGKQRRINRSIGGTIVIFMILVILGSFMLLPIVYAIVTAFKPANEIFIYPPRFWVQHPTIANFITLSEITQETWVPFERSLFNSIFISVVGTFLYIIISSMAAYPLAKKTSRFISFYFQVLVLAILFRPEVTRTPLYIIMSQMKLINTYSSTILPVLAGSFGVFLMRQFIVTIPDETLEAARVDGATEYSVFIRLIMPMVKPAWMTLTIFTFNSLWNTGDTQYIYNESMKTLTSVLQSIASAGIARAGAGAAVALILMIPPVIVFIISQSSVIETMAHTGLKG